MPSGIFGCGVFQSAHSEIGVARFRVSPVPDSDVTFFQTRPIDPGVDVVMNQDIIHKEQTASTKSQHSNLIGSLGRITRVGILGRQHF
jgi:hypothetical protein